MTDFLNRASRRRILKNIVKNVLICAEIKNNFLTLQRFKHLT